MRSVRILTINVQMFPALVRGLQGDLSIFGLALSVVQDILPETLTKWMGEPSADVVERAERIANSLLSVPDHEKPDVILFNELFNEDGREAMISALKETWPHCEAKFAEVDLEDDAGLMVMSRLPFLAVDGSKTRKQVFFSDDADDDTFTSKGAGLVQVSGPTGPLTIVTTHLQSSYDADRQYATERHSQMTQIVKLLEGTYDHAGGIAVCGDLNIRGEPDPEIGYPEWTDTFDRPDEPFGQLLYDAWISMAPLGDRGLWDTGFTNRNTENDEEKRLDYHCLLRPHEPRDPPDIEQNEKALVIHHARVLHRNLSDHNGLEGVYQRWYPHCQPASAINIDKDEEPKVFRAVQATSFVAAVPVNIQAEDGYFWLFLPRAGTYSIGLSDNLEFSFYAHNNVSDALSPADTINFTELPGSLTGQLMSAARHARHGMPEKGVTVASRFPLLVAIRTRLGEDSRRPEGQGVAMVLEHRGESRETAIRLVPHQTIDLPFPSDQNLGTENACWLVLDAPTTLAPKLRSEQIEVFAGGGLSLTLLDTDDNKVLSQDSAPDTLSSLPFEVLGGERRYLRVGRSDFSTGHKATYRTPVSYLRLDRAMGIHVDDETGGDWGGADEPSFHLFADDAQLLSTEWDDADSGEEWPGLQNEIRVAATAALGETRAIPFAEAIAGTVDETDGILTPARGESWFFVDTLKPDTIEQKFRMVMTVKDAIRDGTYTFFCTVSRDP